MSRPDLSLAREFEAALAWWRAAGVDCDFSDDATVWLAEPASAAPGARQAGAAGSRAMPTTPAAISADGSPTAKAAMAGVTPAPAAAPAILRRDLLGDSPPADLASFRQWWLEAPGLDTARSYPRVPPRGKAGAALMVLTVQPEADDREALLAGRQGRLLAAILAAMGLDKSAVYIASALPCHTPMADLPALAAGGLDAVTAHHVGLVAPARLLVFGAGLAPMIGSPSDPPLREINHAGRKIPAMMSETLDALMEMPRLKARFWRRWMEWSATH